MTTPTHTTSTISQIKQRRWVIGLGVNSDPGVAAARKAYFARFAAEEQAMKVREAQLTAKKRAADPTAAAITHPEIDAAIAHCMRGVDRSGKVFAIHYNPATKRGIIGVTSGSCWSGRGQPRSYVAPKRWLVDLARAASSDTIRSGLGYEDDISVKQVERRFPAATEQAWHAWCDDAEAALP